MFASQMFKQSYSALTMHELSNQIIKATFRFRQNAKSVDKAFFGQNSGKIVLDGVNCHGNEASLSACRSNHWGVNDCSHSEDVSVICKKGKGELRL